MDLGFSIYKRDSAFLDVIRDAGVQYLLAKGNYIKATVTSKKSSTTAPSAMLSELPAATNISVLLYGLAFRSDHLDYTPNPRKGFSIKASAGAGTRELKNMSSNASAFDSLASKSSQYQATYETDLFIPLAGRSVFNLGMRGGHLISPTYFQNELFRIGGFKTLRGFDEESIFASSYDILNLELRYLLEQNSYLSAFWNGAYYENRAHYLAGDPYDMPFGFGAGITFDTKLGIFSVSYALGKQFDNPIQVRAGKVSFGLVNNF